MYLGKAWWEISYLLHSLFHVCNRRLWGAQASRHKDRGNAVLTGATSRLLLLLHIVILPLLFILIIAVFWLRSPEGDQSGLFGLLGWLGLWWSSPLGCALGFRLGSRGSGRRWWGRSGFRCRGRWIVFGRVIQGLGGFGHSPIPTKHITHWWATRIILYSVFWGHWQCECWQWMNVS